MNGNRECPVCGQMFKGRGWEGIDAHWRSKTLVDWRGQRILHEDIESYEDAKAAGLLSGRWKHPDERNVR